MAEWIQVHPCVLCAGTSRAKNALERWFRKDVTRAWPGVLSLCSRKHQSHGLLSFLQVPRLVKVVLENSPYFQLISPSDVGRKVAPGMSSTFRIVFTPEENKVRLEIPRGWCLQWQVNLQGWLWNRACGVGFEALPCSQWGCAGSRTGGHSFPVVKMMFSQAGSCCLFQTVFSPVVLEGLMYSLLA